MLGRFVNAAFTAFPRRRGTSPARKVYQLGNPIRRKLMENYLRPDVEHDRLRAARLRRLAGRARAQHARHRGAAAPRRPARARSRITHQTGARDREQVEQGYRACGFEPDVREFIDDMSAAYAGADLVVCRAGATTLAELTVCKKPAILVPFPAAADNHQVMNAQSLVDAGAAVMIEERDLTGELLAARDPRDPRAAPSGASGWRAPPGRLGSPQAAKEIADVCAELVRRRWGSPAGQARAPGHAPRPPARRRLERLRTRTA